MRLKQKVIYLVQAIKNTNMPTPASTTSITLEITIDKPPAAVWQTWVTPAKIMQWNIPFADWHCPRVENDVREGGSFLFRMETKDNSAGFDHAGKYDKVTVNELIEYTGNDGRRSIIEFISQGNATLLRETFEPEKENSIEMQKDFCQAVLNNFKRHAEKE
jgi:uncharacterized protein YndB with AHSA1/START domain